MQSMAAKIPRVNSNGLMAVSQIVFPLTTQDANGLVLAPSQNSWLISFQRHIDANAQAKAEQKSD